MWKESAAGTRSSSRMKYLPALAFQYEASEDGDLVGAELDVAAVANTQVGTVFLADLTAAEITAVSSTTISVDAGGPPPSGGGFEVRWSDYGLGTGEQTAIW